MSHTGKKGEWMKRITKIDMAEPLITKKLRVAAYCRVSTGSDEQLVSLEAQKSHYESFIKANPEWEFAGVYYDEGITGTKKEKRTQLLRLISDCEAHKVDFIVVKSISRFARNTTDCLELVRKLRRASLFQFLKTANGESKEGSRTARSRFPIRHTDMIMWTGEWRSTRSRQRL